MSETGSIEFTNIRYGRPRGSILGPTLFLIFINGLPLNFDFCFSAFNADGGTVHIQDKTLKPLKSSYKEILIMQSKENKLPLIYNKITFPLIYNKTTFITIGTRKRINDSRTLNLHVDEVCIQTCTHRNYSVFILTST